LQAFGPTGSWGRPKSPNCRGFTPEEFQMLDFDNIDLSEWYGDIVTQTQQNITNTMQNKIEDFYEEIQ
jgi:conjugal transfer mating pair stabilization protein TraN